MDTTGILWQLSEMIIFFTVIGVLVMLCLLCVECLGYGLSLFTRRASFTVHGQITKEDVALLLRRLRNTTCKTRGVQFDVYFQGHWGLSKWPTIEPVRTPQLAELCRELAKSKMRIVVHVKVEPAAVDGIEYVVWAADELHTLACREFPPIAFTKLDTFQADAAVRHLLRAQGHTDGDIARLMGSFQRDFSEQHTRVFLREIDTNRLASRQEPPRADALIRAGIAAKTVTATDLRNALPGFVVLGDAC